MLYQSNYVTVNEQKLSVLYLQHSLGNELTKPFSVIVYISFAAAAFSLSRLKTDEYC